MLLWIDKVFTTEPCNQQSTSVFGCTIFKLIWVMLLQSSRNVSVLSDMTSKIWADFAKD